MMGKLKDLTGLFPGSKYHLALTELKQNETAELVSAVSGAV
jgi:hypothetical protein